MLTSGRLPAAIVAGAALAVVVAHDVSPADALAFFAYVALAIVLPGVLLVRAMRGGPSHIAEDLALGLALGYCVLIAAYLAARAVGLPQLHVVWAIATVAAFIGVRRLRPLWRGSGERAPLAWTWAICLILGLLLVHAAGLYQTHRLVGMDTPYVDMPYQLALIGELRHHVPPQVPYVAGEPLAYHWFFYVQAAAASWITGVEPVVLLYRLAVLPMQAGFVVLTAVAARRVTGRWWPGPLAAILALIGTVPSLHGWLGESAFVSVPAVFDTEPLGVAWVSPTHTFGLLLFAAALLVILDRLGPRSVPSTGQWVLFAVLAFGMSGAKASALPLLLSGLVVVLLVTALRARMLHRSALVAVVIVLVALGFAVAFVFQGESGGLQVGLDSLRRFRVPFTVGAVAARGTSALVVPAIALGSGVILWAVQGASVFALVLGPRHERGDNRLWLLLGILAGGLGAASVLSYPGLSQWYYLRGSAGVFGILAAWGIARLAGSRPDWRGALAIASAALLGAAAGLVVRSLGPTEAPSLRRDGLLAVTIEIVAPVAILVVVLCLGVLVCRVIAGRTGVPAPLLGVVLAMGTALPAAVGVAAEPVLTAPRAGDAVPSQGMEAARWLRSHSTPDDLVATNMHCRMRLIEGRCDPRHFWVSGHSERRILVEGWAYTAKAHEAAGPLGPAADPGFWDPERLAVNDRAFTDPALGVARLRDEYGVRWLFADLDVADEKGLSSAAIERFRAGRYAVYEIPGSGQPAR